MFSILRYRYLRKHNFMRFSTESNESKEIRVDRSSKDFVPVYKFKFIQQFAIINRLKFYQTAVTAVATPLAIALDFFQVIDKNDMVTVLYMGTSGCMILYTLGFFTQKFIGLIYYDEQTGMVKISYPDFWGKRKDIEVPKNDIVPLSELQYVVTDSLFLTFRRFSTKDTLRFNKNFGVILDSQKFSKVFESNEV